MAVVVGRRFGLVVPVLSVTCSRALGAVLLLTLCLFSWGCGGAAQAESADPAEDNRAKQARAVDLYFFWSSRCPHCREARPFVETLPQRHSWIRLHSLELLENPENRQRFQRMAEQVGFVPNAVPTFVWCGRHHTGFGTEAGTGAFLEAALLQCYSERYGGPPPGAAGQAGPSAADLPPVDIPWLGSLDMGAYSLPVLAVILGALDAFNPCAFFVLLFLLSLLVNTRSRGRMVLVGGLFVAVSGVVYFLFMAAWLNVFRLVGAVQTITLAAGVMALFIGAVNVKDYFWFKRGLSLSLSQRSENRLVARMRGLLAADHLPTLLVGTLTLAVAANSYELLCTLGLPMVFTRLLTLEELPTLQYYGYLALYNLVYVMPLTVIVGVFVATMGRRKLSQTEGRFLKLISGTLMAGLGAMLVVAPERLSHPLSAVSLVLFAVALSCLIDWLWRRRVAGD